MNLNKELIMKKIQYLAFSSLTFLSSFSSVFAADTDQKIKALEAQIQNLQSQIEEIKHTSSKQTEVSSQSKGTVFSMRPGPVLETEDGSSSIQLKTRLQVDSAFFADD